jgi:glycosyltransferase involved in cell wall biosynthesis
MTDFSVIIPVYFKETASNLHDCLKSLSEQTVPATEIVIIKDGFLTEELEDVLNEWLKKIPLKIIGYEENKGIIYALNYGLGFCSYELVARMDSDDICLPNRFEKQIKYFEENNDVVLLSGFISEFNKIPNDISSVRKVPKGTNNIIKYLKSKSAFNHMAVMYKKSVIISLEGYGEVHGLEDYDLWIKVVQAGYKVDNLQEVLVYARIGNNMLARRSGIEYAKKEIYFLFCQRKRKFISNLELLGLLLTRVPLRLIHPKLLSLLYYKILRNKK